MDTLLPIITKSVMGNNGPHFYPFLTWSMMIRKHNQSFTVVVKVKYCCCEGEGTATLAVAITGTVIHNKLRLL